MSDSNQKLDTLWYKKGLRFQCTECGQCCTGAPGYVWLTKKDIDQIAQRLYISKKTFIKKYTRFISGRLSLLEDPKNFDCIFLKNKKCTIYKDRPTQCRTFPFWKQHLVSKKAWRQAAQYCEGIDHPHAPLLSMQEIEKKFF